MPLPNDNDFEMALLHENEEPVVSRASLRCRFVTCRVGQNHSYIRIYVGLARTLYIHRI